MGAENDIDRMIAQVQVLLNTRLGVRKGTLEAMARRAGRRLPRRLRKHALALTRAQKLAAHPKLARQLDRKTLTAGFNEITTYLEKIDPNARRKMFALRLAGVLAFNVIAVAGGFIFWLWWAGYV